MQLHELRPIHKSKKQKRVGRGGSHGFHTGRGNEGQKSRAGARLKPLIRELIKKYPKLRGYKFKSNVNDQKTNAVIIGLEVLEKKFDSGQLVSPVILLKKGIIKKIRGWMPKVKILGGGKLTKSLTIEDCTFSKSAKAAVEKAGGTIK